MRDSTPFNMDAKELSLVLISFAMVTGDDRGTVCDKTSARKGSATRIRTHRVQKTYHRTAAFPRRTAFGHINQLYALVLHENACYEWKDTICLSLQSIAPERAGIAILVRRALTRPCRFRRPDSPFRRLSKHLAATIASIGEDLFAYLSSLYVARR